MDHSVLRMSIVCSMNGWQKYEDNSKANTFAVTASRWLQSDKYLGPLTPLQILYLCSQFALMHCTRCSLPEPDDFTEELVVCRCCILMRSCTCNPLSGAHCQSNMMRCVQVLYLGRSCTSSTLSVAHHQSLVASQRQFCVLCAGAASGRGAAQAHCGPRGGRGSSG